MNAGLEPKVVIIGWLPPNGGQDNGFDLKILLYTDNVNKIVGLLFNGNQRFDVAKHEQVPETVQ